MELQESQRAHIWNVSRKGVYPEGPSTLGRSRRPSLRNQSLWSCFPQVPPWEQQHLAGRLSQGSPGDSVLIPLAQVGHRPLSRTQSSPAAPVSMLSPEPTCQTQVLNSSETPATGKTREGL